eukprot:10384472-Prorocentrum_lima.AAC.1
MPSKPHALLAGSAASIARTSSNEGMSVRSKTAWVGTGGAASASAMKRSWCTGVPPSSTAKRFSRASTVSAMP